MKKNTNIMRITIRNMSNIYGKRVVDAEYAFINDDGKQVKCVLSDNGTVHTVDMDKVIKRMPIELDRNNAYTFDYDIGRESLDKKAIKKWAANHPDLGPANYTSESEYVIVFDDEVIDNTYEDDDEKYDVFSKFKVLDANQRNGISVHFGIEPWDLNERELRNRLVSFDSGIITTDKDCRNDFLNNIDTVFNPITLNFQAAVLCGVIGGSESGVYTLNGEVLGSSKEACIAVLMQRPELFSIIERELKKKAKFIYTKSEAKTISQESGKGSAAEQTNAELNALGAGAGQTAEAAKAEADAKAKKDADAQNANNTNAKKAGGGK